MVTERTWDVGTGSLKIAAVIGDLQKAAIAYFDAHPELDPEMTSLEFSHTAVTGHIDLTQQPGFPIAKWYYDGDTAIPFGRPRELTEDEKTVRETLLGQLEEKLLPEDDPEDCPWDRTTMLTINPLSGGSKEDPKYLEILSPPTMDGNRVWTHAILSPFMSYKIKILDRNGRGNFGYELTIHGEFIPDPDGKFLHQQIIESHPT